ncbi:hypothetical protein HELRODRAFT_191484 [Helobdella robusta]|uniref:SH2 domain-containing protein n=1 Tax=Helobdella robusta TaxID=6412 RepID=T1FT10_HELRO|nr:hypothetical protein HELRODRAFT_191484 [Helobdella robusta]ESO04862.1 hypothetical protein HELRODRAFT_191484 [Helobdella robusta]
MLKKWLKLIRERLEKMPKSDQPKRKNNNNNSSNNNKVKNIKSVKFTKSDDSDDDDVGTNYVIENEKDDEDDDDDYSDLEREKMDDYEIPSVESGKESIINEKLNKRWDAVPLPAIPVDQKRSKNSRNNQEDEGDNSMAIYNEPDELPATTTKSRSSSSTTTPPTTTSVSKISSKLAGRIAAVENNVANSILPKAPKLPAKKPPPTPLKYEPTFPNQERRSQDNNNARTPDKPKEKPPTLKKPGRPEMKVSPQVQTPKPAVPGPDVEPVYEIDSLSVNYSALVNKAMWNKDPNKATEVMSAIIKVIGAFLIRKSTDGDGYTLSVACEDGPKKFKITCQGSQLVMDGNTFDDMSKLIEYYFTNNLPHKSHTLSKPYSELWSST